MSHATKYTVACPHCGLILTIRKGDGGFVLAYDDKEWRGKCERGEKQSPAFCLSEVSSPLGDRRPDGCGSL
jgi:hypothetical protein